jgi:hypothetical protein
MSRALAPPSAPATGLKQVGQFALHYLEMCAAMCIGFAAGDALYFWLASLAGYSKPFSQLPVLSVVLVTVFMTAPMTAWMLHRGMPRRAIVEMSAAMPILAVALLGLGWIGALPMSSLALAEHALMMPAMLIPMLLDLDLYTGRGGRPAIAP